MKITTLDKTVADLLKDFLFIPAFQRPYSWETQHVEQFWRDTIIERDGDYFIGAVVVYKQGDALGIVDGQQRVTTMLMTLAALRNAFEASKLTAPAAGIQAIIEKTDIDNKKRFVLTTETSFPYLQDKILNAGKPQFNEALGPEEESLRKMFDLLQQHVKTALKDWATKVPASERDESILKSIRDSVLGLKLITIELDNEDDAFTIFETLNTRGKDLDTSHLLKNHLSRLLKVKTKGVDPVKIKWATFLDVLESSQADIDADDFLHHFWLSRAKYVTAKKLFEDIKKGVKTADQAELILDDLIADAKLYRAILEPDYGKWKKEELAIRRSLEALGVFRVRQPFPLVLSVMRAYKHKNISKKNAEALLWAIERFHFAFTAVTSKSSSGGLSLMYAAWAKSMFLASSQSAIQKAINDVVKGLTGRHPTKADFVVAFKEIRYSEQFTKQKKLVQYILRMIADHSAGGVEINHDQMTIEHVAPQNPSGSTTISDDHVAMLGNLLWCDSKIQKQLDNRAFAEKRQILKDSKVPASEEVTKASVWDEKQIVARTNAMAKSAYDEIWKK